MPESPIHPGPSSHALLTWTLRRVRHHLNSYGYRLTQDGGELSDLFVSLDEVQRVLGSGEAHRARYLGLPEAAEDEPLPAVDSLDTLRRRFELNELEARLLVAAAAPGLSVDIDRLYTFAWADFTRKRPSMGFLAELVAGRFGFPAALDAFAADRPLRRHNLIALRHSEGGDGPLNHAGVVVPEAVLGWLRATADGAPPRPTPPDHPVDGDAHRLLTAVARQMALDPTEVLPLQLVGAPGLGRRSLLRAVLAERGIGLRAVEVEGPPYDAAAFDEALDAAARAARYEGAALLVAVDALPDDDALAELVLPRLKALSESHRGVLALTVRRPDPRVPQRLEGTLDVLFRQPDVQTQRTLWRQALGSAVPAEVAETMIRRFDLTPGTIQGAVRAVRHRARFEPVSPATMPAALSDAVRQHTLHTLRSFAEPVETTLDWADIVLPDETVQTLREIELQARHRHLVFDTWGFADKIPYGRGLACLFSGPPGTGKTMMAGIIARSVGLVMYRVDVSRLVSKWVGETEKNLSRVFDEAEKAQAMLLFDEADSLFAKRTEVKGANDRFANMEVNYLLQRMERFEGMSILTTNFERSLDDAFKRRLRFKVQFMLPDADERALLWQRMVPARMRVADGVDWSRLGRVFKLSGGGIKNAVLRAAFLAADGDGVLTMQRLMTAGKAELRELGRL